MSKMLKIVPRNLQKFYQLKIIPDVTSLQHWTLNTELFGKFCKMLNIKSEKKFLGTQCCTKNSKKGECPKPKLSQNGRKFLLILKRWKLIIKKHIFSSLSFKFCKLYS